MSQSNQETSAITSAENSAVTGAENNAVASPCIDICDLDDDGICIGCYRAIEEIAGWSMLDNTEKLEIIELSNKRREAAK